MSREYFNNDKVTISDEAVRLYKKSVVERADTEAKIISMKEMRPKKESYLGLYFLLFSLASGILVGTYVITSFIVEALRKVPL